MSLRAARVRNWVAQGALYSGLVVIVLAIVLNVLSPRLSSSGLPPELVKRYSSAGPVGATLLLLFVGGALVLSGLALRPSHPEPTRLARAHFGTTAPMFTPPDPGEVEPAMTPSGRVILRTQKYLTNKPTDPRDFM